MSLQRSSKTITMDPEKLITAKIQAILERNNHDYLLERATLDNNAKPLRNKLQLINPTKLSSYRHSFQQPLKELAQPVHQRAQPLRRFSLPRLDRPLQAVSQYSSQYVKHPTPAISKKPIVIEQSHPFVGSSLYRESYAGASVPPEQPILPNPEIRLTVGLPFQGSSSYKSKFDLKPIISQAPPSRSSLGPLPRYSVKSESAYSQCYKPIKRQPQLQPCQNQQTSALLSPSRCEDVARSEYQDSLRPLENRLSKPIISEGFKILFEADEQQQIIE